MIINNTTANNPRTIKLSKEQLGRYDRHLKLKTVGVEGQIKLLNSTILMVGAGGLGCPALQYLVAAGVGRIYLFDSDVVDMSNLQRQILFTPNDIGQNKAKVAASKLMVQNPDVEIIALEQSFDVEAAQKYIPEVDLVIDGTDNFQTRYLINDACVLNDKPFVYGALDKFSAQLSVFNYQGGPSYRCLYPQMPAPESVPSCSQAGVLGVLPGIVGSLQALEALKVLLDLGDSLAGKLLMFDGLGQVYQTLKCPRNEAQIEKVVENGLTGCEYVDDFICGLRSTREAAGKSEDILRQIEASELLEFSENRKVILVDIRGAEERELASIPKDVHCPDGDGLGELIQENPEAHVVLYCHLGHRSLMYCKQYPSVYNLGGGVRAYATDVDEGIEVY